MRAGWRRVGMVLALGLLLAFLVPLAGVAVHRFVPVPATWLALQRSLEGKEYHRRWKPLRQISPNLVYAVIAAEDARFCEHRGFDLEGIRKAMVANAKGRRLRGGSTISQQTAKNVFLWPGRGWIRKGAEAWYTVLMETLWGKRRIMEVYLNQVEWAPGVYGAEAAARHWFGTSAAKLSPGQAARLAAILPRPLKWKAASSGPYVKKRTGRIQPGAGTVRTRGLAHCVLRS